MKIVIAGAGEVGTHLAKLLTHEAQDIIIVDRNIDKLQQLDASYNLMTMVGNPTSPRDLRQAGVKGCDLFIAVTPYEANNVVACGIAKHYGAKCTMARVDSYEYFDKTNTSFFDSVGVDNRVYPEDLAAREIIRALSLTWARSNVSLLDGKIAVVSVKVREGAPVLGMRLRDVTSTQHYLHVVAIKRDHMTIIPRGDTEIMLNDIVMFATTDEYLDRIRELCGKTARRIRRVMIMGAGRIAIRTMVLGADKYKFKVIDSDKEVCLRLPERVPDCDIVCGDGRDNDLLAEEGLADTDAFVALTESSETNILACLTAKEFGVKKTIAEVENIQLINEAETLNIGTIVNKKLLAAAKIFQLLLDTDAESSKCMVMADAEVAELVVRPGSRISSAPVKKLKLYKEMTLAAMMRGDHYGLINGDTHLQAGDKVVVFSLAGMLHKVEKLFL